MKCRMFARRAGLRVSELALGAGMFGGAVDAAAAHAVLTAYGRSIPRHGAHWEIITGTVPTPVGMRGA
jgi:hypothetical protein